MPSGRSRAATGEDCAVAYVGPSPFRSRQRVAGGLCASPPAPIPRATCRPPRPLPDPVEQLEAFRLAVHHRHYPRPFQPHRSDDTFQNLHGGPQQGGSLVRSGTIGEASGTPSDRAARGCRRPADFLTLTPRRPRTAGERPTARPYDWISRIAAIRACSAPATDKSATIRP